MKRLNWARVGLIHVENTDLAGGTKVRVSVTGQKYHRLRHKKILDGYDNFISYVVIGSLKATANFGRLDVRRCMMTSEASRVVSSISHNNKNTTVLSTLSYNSREIGRAS